MVLEGDVVCVGQVFYIKIRFCLLYAGRGQRCGLGLFVDNIVCVFIELVVVLFGIQVGDLDHMERLRKCIRNVIQLGGLVPLAGNNQRGTRFVDEDGVNLVDDGEIVPALHFVFLIDDHVVAQIVEAELVVRTIGNVGIVSLLAGSIVHIVGNQADRQTKEAVQLAHPFGVAAGQIVVDGNHVDALACQAVQIRGERRHKRFTFTGLHLGDTALMEHDAADDLHREVAHLQHAGRSLAADGKCVWQDVVQRFAVGQAFL